MRPTRCTVIGAGLAGAAVAASLARRGWQVTALDAAAQPAMGASALPAGLLAPHLSRDDHLISRLSRAGVALTLAEAQAQLEEDVGWAPTPVLERRARTGLPAFDDGTVLADWHRWATPHERQAAGLPFSDEAVWHLRAAWIRPAALVGAWLATPGVHFMGSTAVVSVLPEAGSWICRDAQGREVARSALVVLAAALGSAPLCDGRLWLHAVRGQVSFGNTAPGLALPHHPVNGNGHFLPAVRIGGRTAWLTGSTYGRTDTDATVRTADQQANLERLAALLPDVAQRLVPAFAAGEASAWAGVRCASHDRRPLVGELAPRLWVSTAMGSRGLTFALLCAELLAARLHAEPLPLPAELAAALDLARQRPTALSGLSS